MKRVKLISGQWSEKGNYSAYDKNRTRYFISKVTMESLGFKAGEAVTFPIFALATTNQIGQLNAEGETLMDADNKAVVVDRLEATVLYKTREELIASVVEDATLDIEISKAINAVATTAGLSQANIDALLTASV